MITRLNRLRRARSGHPAGNRLPTAAAHPGDCPGRRDWSAWRKIVFGFLVNLFERGCTALGYAYSPELFDTRSRSLGTGISYGLGGLSNAASPLIVAALHQSNGYRSVFYFIAGTWLLAAVILAAFGPHTRTVRVAASQGRQAVRAS